MCKNATDGEKKWKIGFGKKCNWGCALHLQDSEHVQWHLPPIGVITSKTETSGTNPDPKEQPYPTRGLQITIKKLQALILTPWNHISCGTFRHLLFLMASIVFLRAHVYCSTHQRASAHGCKSMGNPRSSRTMQQSVFKKMAVQHKFVWAFKIPPNPDCKSPKRL